MKRFVVIFLLKKMMLPLSGLKSPIPQLLIGEIRVLLLESKTRDTAVPAGLSQLLVPWRVLTRLNLVILFLSLSSSLLIAILAATVATVVTKVELSSMLKLIK